MFRVFFIVGVLFACMSLGSMNAAAQTSEQLKKRTQGMESAQKESWKQIDAINKETDNTRARLQQARKSEEQAYEKSGYTVKKTQVGTKSAYKKVKPPKSSATKKKK